MNIEAEMISSISFNENYKTPPLITDWKIDKLAVAMANAQHYGAKEEFFTTPE